MLSKTARMAGFAAATAIMALTIPVSAADVEWDGYTYSPATAVAYKGLEQMAEAVREQTGGTFEIRVSGGGSLPINATNITQAVGDGILDLAGDGFYAGNLTMGGLLFLPGLVQTADELDMALKAIDGPLREELAEQDVELLAYYNYPLQVIWSVTEIRSLDDMRGKKVRSTSPEQAEFVRRFGGVPITLSTSEVAPALQRGVIDGVMTAASAGARRYQDTLKYAYLLGPNLHTSFIIANKAAFEALTDEQKEILRSEAGKAGQWITDQLSSEEDSLIEQFAAGGMEVTAASEADQKAFLDTIQSYWGEWAEARGGRAEEAVETIRATLGR